MFRIIPEAFGREKLESVQKHYLSALSTLSVAKIDKIWVG
jgi:hypothetical protein